MASTPTCLSCQRPFPPNATLATLPDARRLAVDPARGRAWRICEHCGEWNLLGPEVASLVNAEASVLFRVGPVRRVDEGLELVRLPDLALLRLDLEPGTLGDDAFESRQGKLLTRQTRLGTVSAILLLLILTLIGLAVFAPESIPGTLGAGGLLRLGLTVASASVMANWWRLRRLRFSQGRGPVVVAIMLIIGATVIEPSTDHARHLAMIWPSLLVLSVMSDRWLPFGWTRLPGGGRVVLTRHVMDRTRLWLDEDAMLRITLPNERILSKEDGETVLRDLLDGYSWETDNDPQMAGAMLARGIDPLPRVVEQLRPVLNSDPEGLSLARLPAAWRAALDLALAASGGAPGRLSALAARAREAQQVAAIAESLDREQERA